jgi:ABC-type glycerol-3-phosphate transport system substrate-binding protein
MGLSGYFVIGQLESSGEFPFGFTEPFSNMVGERLAPSSTNGYVISGATEYPEEAWGLVTALLEAEFLIETWGKPGHSVPALRSAASASLDPTLPSEAQQAILASMEYSEIFKPYTASAFEVYSRTSDLFFQIMKGDLDVDPGLRQIEDIANETLESDR